MRDMRDAKVKLKTERVLVHLWMHGVLAQIHLALFESCVRGSLVLGGQCC